MAHALKKTIVPGHKHGNSGGNTKVKYFESFCMPDLFSLSFFGTECTAPQTGKEKLNISYIPFGKVAKACHLSKKVEYVPY